MINENIASLRKMRNMSQEELAEKLGITRQTLSKWETGESVPDLDKSKKIADLFNVSLDDLATYEMKENVMPIPPRGKHAFGMVTVGDKGQIVIPAKARKIFKINPGDRLVVLGDEGQGLALLSEKSLMMMLNGMKDI